MSTDKPASKFDHGGFWDRYSSTWDTQGDGVYVPAPGTTDVLGAEWGDDREATAIIEKWVVPQLPKSGLVLEIGPGGGKFSRVLDRHAGKLILADISRAMLDRGAAACRRRPETLLLEGSSLEPLANASIDLVFSYDVFIHLESEEIFRYLGEINRCLKPGGHFLVHTSTFESRFGMLSYFRQIRDHVSQLGTRYGGRMYPMSLAILQRMAEHSGFRVVRSQGDWSDRNLVFLLQKVHPAWMWRFATVTELAERIELCDRVGGSDRRPLYCAHYRKDGAMALVLLGAATDPWMKAAAGARVPAHAGIIAPVSIESVVDGVAVRYAHVRGPSLARHLAGERIEMGSERPMWRLAFALLDTLYTAHQAGLVHGEIAPSNIVIDVERSNLALLGFMEPAAAGIADAAGARSKDWADLAAIIARFELPAGLAGMVAEVLRKLPLGAIEHSELRRIASEIDRHPDAP